MASMGGLGRLLRRGLPALCAALVLAGCASMPSSGEVRKVDDAQRGDADSQVRVFPRSPRPNESPTEIVDGFLEATTGTDADFATAKKYLTKDMGRRWDPESQIRVYSSRSLTQGQDDSTSRKEGFATLTLSAAMAAVVDTKHAFQPDERSFKTSFQLVRQGTQWRIDALENGLVMSSSDFQRVYHSVNMYYFARLGPDGPGGGGGQQTLVADPVYLRNQNDSLVSTVSALLGGPTDWLSPVVRTAAPAGAKLDDKAPDHGVTLDDSQHLKVRLSASADKLPERACIQLAVQLFATVQAQASAKLTAADVQHPDGSTACSVPDSQAKTYGPGNLIVPPNRLYYVSADSQHRLMAMDPASKATRSEPVAGPLGANKAGLDTVAVSRDESRAAVVRGGGHDLVVAPLSDDALPAPALTSKGPDVKDALSAPSWDGFGDLWVADRDPQAATLYVLLGGDAPPQKVPVEDLDGRVESLRVSSDGVRIALIVQKDGKKRLELGRIERSGTPEHPVFEVTGLRVLSPAGEDITSVSWAGASRLVVLASETGGAQQIEYMNTDGSAGTALQGVSEASSVAASEDATSPLLASYDDSVYLLPADADWKQLTPKGTGPVYPG